MSLTYGRIIVLPAIRPIDREIPLPQVNAGIAASRRMLSVLS